MKEQNLILPGIKLIKSTLYLEKENALILADLHLGYEDCLIKNRILIPRVNFKEILLDLSEVIKRIKLDYVNWNGFKLIIINGDLKHEFGSISEQEWAEVIELINFLLNYTKKIVLIKGNHDNVVKPIISFKKLELKEYYFFKESKLLVLHGNKTLRVPELKKAKTIVIGHEHPAISFKENKSQKYKVLLLGKFKKKNLIVLPSMFKLREGINLLREKRLSPFLKENLKGFFVWVVEDKEYFFGQIKDLEEFL